MATKPDFHNKRQRLRLKLERLEAHDFSKFRDPLIDRNRTPSKKDIQLIIDFIDDCAARGIKESRCLTYCDQLFNIASWLSTSFSTVTKKDIKKLVGLIESSSYSANTKQNYKVTIKRFFSWLKNDPHPEITDWISITVKKSEKSLPEKILTPQDVEKIIKKARHIRDKAFLSLLWESGCRIGEILSLKIKNVQFDRLGAVVTFPSGKTGSRRVRVIESVPYLSSWKAQHPEKDNEEAAFFVNIGTNNFGKPLNYRAARFLVESIARRAGFEKIHPHIFRHSRATFLAKYLTEQQMKIYLGWAPDSKMAGVYVHMSGRDTDNAILSIYGMKEEQKQEVLNKPLRCKRCDSLNEPEAKFCAKCGMPLSLEVAMEVDDKLKKVNQFMEMLNKYDGSLDRLIKAIKEEGLT